ncbi:MAG: hypothetical protein ACXWT3_07630 [Methylococcaceae bacterium]
MSETPDIATISIRQRSAFAVQHLMAAARFSRQCGEIQEANQGSPLGAFYDEQIACVSATIMLSVASLESNINEHLVDSDNLLHEIPKGAREQFCALLSSSPIVEKYERVLTAKELEPFNRGEAPYQDVDILVAIRNELVHFHPEWHDEQERHEKLGNRLRYRFELSPFIAKEEGVLFPQRFVSHGCTKWAVESALAFMELFAEKVDAPNRFSKHRHRLHG